jgi:hypothetical protein
MAMMSAKDAAMRITDEVVEAGAIALRTEVGDRLGRGRPWNALPASLRNSYRAEARAAITAALQASVTSCGAEYTPTTTTIRSNGSCEGDKDQK